MPRFPELKEFVPANPLDAAANALDPIAFLGNWPNRKAKARLAVVKVLTELRNSEGWPALSAAGREAIDTSADYNEPTEFAAQAAWSVMIDAILAHDPGGR